MHTIPSPTERIARADLQDLLATHPLPALRDKRLLLTGATGFMGYWLLTAIDLLNAAGQNLEVVAISRQPTRFTTRHPSLAGAPWLRLVRGDVRDADLPDGPFDLMIHGAGDTSTAAAAAPLELYDAIVTGSRRMLEHAVDRNCERILLLGSGAIYGSPTVTPLIAEDHPCTGDPGDLANVYAEGKRAMETLAGCMHRTYGIQTVIARCFAFVGAGLPLDGHFAIGNFIGDALAGRPIHIRGSGQALRSYLYAADLAIWLLTLLLTGRGGDAYNVGADRGYSIVQIAELVRDLLAPRLPIEVANRQARELRPSYVPDIGKARAELGLDAWTPLSTAIRRTAASHAPQGMQAAS